MTRALQEQSQLCENSLREKDKAETTWWSGEVGVPGGGGGGEGRQLKMY